MDDMHAFPLIMNFLVMPMFFLSGSLFPVQGLPSVIRSIITVNPLSYGVDGLRGTLVNGAHFGLMNDFLALAAGTVLLVAIGNYFFSKIEI